MEKERGQGVYLVVGFKRAKLSLEWRSYARRSLFLVPLPPLSLSLSVFNAASAHRVFAAFQSGKFSNAITLPPCVCLDKGIMRFYASCACFHGFLAVVYAPARREKIFEEARFSIHQRERCAALVLASSRPFSLFLSSAHGRLGLRRFDLSFRDDVDGYVVDWENVTLRGFLLGYEIDSARRISRIVTVEDFLL